MQEYVKNHITTASYLNNFTDETGVLAVRRLLTDDRHAVLDKPRNVAFRKHFWGRSPELRKAIERALSDLEEKVAPGLPELPQRWPLPYPAEERLDLACFVAVHLLRTPGWKYLVPILGERFIRENEPQLLGQFRMTAPEMSAVARSDDWRATLFAEQVELVGKTLAAMHWTLVSFAERVLVTGDQPVIAVPFDQSAAHETVAPLPAAGLLHTFEFRFATDPRHLLLLTWIETDETSELVAGTPWVAATANRAIRAQADHEWFHHPAAKPLFVAPPFQPVSTAYEPISPRLFASYSVDRALRSRRRRSVERHVHREIDAGVTADLREAFPRRAA